MQKHTRFTLEQGRDPLTGVLKPSPAERGGVMRASCQRFCIPTPTAYSMHYKPALQMSMILAAD